MYVVVYGNKDGLLFGSIGVWTRRYILSVCLLNPYPAGHDSESGCNVSRLTAGTLEFVPRIDNPLNPGLTLSLPFME